MPTTVRYCDHVYYDPSGTKVKEIVREAVETWESGEDTREVRVTPIITGEARQGVLDEIGALDLYEPPEDPEE